MNNTQISFHILLPTIGKDSIFTMLKSIKNQVSVHDYLTIVFDGPELPNIIKVKEYTNDFVCTINIIVEDTKLGYWGHGIRNKHNILLGDFIWHVDDDDIITENSMSVIRNKCKDLNTIYIFKMILDDNNNIIWKNKRILPNEIGTPMGIVPMKLNSTSLFTFCYGGDYEFYKTLENNNPNSNIEYNEDIIYRVRP